MAPMPAVVILFVCKTVLAGPPDQNASYTHWENRDWAYTNSMMTCRRHEIQLYNPDETASFSPMACMTAAVRQATEWDLEHQGSDYRVWRVACPQPIYSDATGNGPSPDDPIVDWTLPPCGHQDTIICEVDSQI